MTLVIGLSRLVGGGARRVVPLIALALGLFLYVSLLSDLGLRDTGFNNILKYK